MAGSVLAAAVSGRVAVILGQGLAQGAPENSAAAIRSYSMRTKRLIAVLAVIFVTLLVDESP